MRWLIPSAVYEILPAKAETGFAQKLSHTPRKLANVESVGKKPRLAISQNLGKNNPLNADFAKSYVEKEAIKAGVNPNIALFVLSKESQNCQNLIGDGGDSRGCWMINKVWHPEISDACAFDLKCSTRFFMKQVIAGKLSEWSSWRLREKLYADAIY